MNENVSPLTLGELSETEVLKRIFPRLPESSHTIVGPGDDSAVLSTPDSRLVISSDMMVQGPDFRKEWSSPEDVGYKAAATNMSDIAAMGAYPTALIVSLAAPSSTEVYWLERFADGLKQACDDLAPGCGVVGGDLSVSSVLTVSVTICGDLGGRKPLLRSAAQPGDVLAYAGVLGRAGLGLQELFSEDNSSIHPNLRLAQLRPQPPIRLGIVANDGGAHAGMDVSDSLVMDAGRMATASQVAVHLDERVIDQLAGQLAAECGVDASRARQAILFGGEDHGLLMTFPQNKELPEGFMPLGSITEGKPEVYLGEVTLEQKGWDPYTAWSGDVS